MDEQELHQQVDQDKLMATTPELPPEILAQILAYVQEGFSCDERALFDEIEQQRALAKLSTVCWSWRRATLPHLLRKPYLQSLRQWRNFFRFVQDCKRWGQYVRVLRETPVVPETHETYLGAEHLLALLRLCPNVEDLTVDCSHLRLPHQYLEPFLHARRHIDPCCSRWTTLTFRMYRPGWDHLFMHVIHANPFLQTLRLDVIWFEMIQLIQLIQLNIFLTVLTIRQHLTRLEFQMPLRQEMRDEIERARPERVTISYTMN